MLFESRNQSNVGMLVVADVVISRLDKQYRGATSIQDVVNRPAAFSYKFDRAPDVLLDGELDEAYTAFRMAEKLLNDYEAGEWIPLTISAACPEGATHYHHVDVEPKGWNDYTTCAVINQHVFKYGK